jgi:ankyrin repeat protein
MLNIVLSYVFMTVCCLTKKESVMPKIIIEGEKEFEPYICPISHYIMEDPVVAADGFTYDRKSIEEWLITQGKDTSPMTNEKLKHKDLTANHFVGSQIKQLFSEKNICSQEEFFKAVSTGNPEEIKKLKYLDVYLAAKTKKHGSTALHDAAWNGHKDMVNFLLVEGAKLEATNLYGSTPLHAAVCNGKADVVEILLKDYRANVEALNKRKETPLHDAVNCGHVNIIEALLNNGANIEARDCDGETPLHWAASGNQVNAAKLLLERGADYKAISDTCSPAELAANSGNSDMARLIPEYHQKLKNAAKQVPSEIAKLKKIIQRLDDQVQQLTLQVQQFQNNNNNNIKDRPSSPGFFNQ